MGALSDDMQRHQGTSLNLSSSHMCIKGNPSQVSAFLRTEIIAHKGILGLMFREQGIKFSLKVRYGNKLQKHHVRIA